MDLFLNATKSELNILPKIYNKMCHFSRHNSYTNSIAPKSNMPKLNPQDKSLLNTSVKLRDKLFDASLELNDMQNQIVAYQNKIYRYEDMSENAPSPNPYLVTKRHISVDTSAVQFNRADMMNVTAALRNYSERVLHHIKTI